MNSFIDINIGFEQPAYTYQEREQFQTIYLVKEEGRESEQTFLLALQQGPAQDTGFPLALTGDGGDYAIGQALQQLYRFSSGMQRLPVSFRILADDRSEGIEVFGISSTPNRGSVPFLEGRFPVTIIYIADDGETTVTRYQRISVIILYR